MKKLVVIISGLALFGLLTGCALKDGGHYGDYRQGEPAVPDEWTWPSENGP